MAHSKTTFRKGTSGNPNGKPPGARNKTTIMLEKLLADDAEAVAKAVIAAAKGGDMTAARMVLDRLAPAPRARRIQLDLPPIDTAGDVLEALTATAAAMAAGELTPDEAGTVAGVLEAKRRAVETVDLERRITAIEEQSNRSRWWPSRVTLSQSSWDLK